MMGNLDNLNKIKQILGNSPIGIIGEELEYKRYAVAVPLVERDNEMHVLFQVRAKSLRSQPGEISFPGGRIEKGEENLEAALRETSEELGIDYSNMEVLGASDILITPHNRIIYPFGIYIKDSNLVKPSEVEVDHVFYVPLSFFKENEPLIKSVKVVSEPDDEFFPYEDMKKVKMSQYKWDTGKNAIYFYRYRNYIIWGITAKILYNFLGKTRML
jgi:peroxisomal coenzyme A diphosphatase NUDT7